MTILEKVAQLLGLAKQESKNKDMERQVTCYNLEEAKKCQAKTETAFCPKVDADVKPAIKKLQEAVEKLEYNKRNVGPNRQQNRFDNRKKDFRNPPK